MILLIDNYDSFTYNLVQYLAELGARLKVVRNDAMTVEQVERLAPDRIVISPGPGRPEKAGICIDLIRAVAGRIPLLGVCLGHQCLGAAYGGRIVHATRLMHGKTSRIRHDGEGIFAGVANPFEATRYHSLVIEPGSLPEEIEVIARTDDPDAEIMAVRHRGLPLWGVQFHPESILTAEGKTILKNFLRME